MTSPKRLVLTVALLFGGWNSAISQVPSVVTPPFPQMFVGGPEFHTKVGNRFAGSACLAKFDDSVHIYLLTVRHLLGPSGGFPQLVPPDQIPSFVTSIRFQHLFTPGSKLYRVEGLKVPEAPDFKDPLFDAAIFKTGDASSSDAASVTREKPALQEAVWLISHVRGGVPQGQYIHSARVTGNSGRWLLCEFDNSEIVTNGASGAPVLNASGKIVGIYSGHSKRNGKVIAFVIPSKLIADVALSQR